MDTQTLKTFLLLSQTKNFTQTARQLFVAQSTVTSRIAELEKELGKKLFSREKKNIDLTQEGLLFLTYAKRILDLEASSIQELNRLINTHAPLRIGTSNTIYDCYLYPRMRTFLKKYPHIPLNVTLRLSPALLHMLQDGLLDMVFSYLPFEKSGYTSTLYASDELVLVTHPDHLEYLSGIQREDFSSLNYLFCDFVHQGVSEFIKELFPPFYPFTLEIDNTPKLIEYLLDGIGYSFLPHSLVAPYLKEKRLITIPLLDFQTPKLNNYCCYKSDNDMARFYLRST